MNSKKEVQHVYLVGAKSLGAYGGYETFVYKLTEYHQNKENIKYHVACKANGDGCMDESKFEGVIKINDHEFEFHNAHCFKIDVPQIGSAQAIYYDVAALKACCEHIKKNHIPHPIVYIMACRIGPFAGHFYREIHKLGGTVILNPDGHEWMRAKWSAPIRKYWKISEQMMVKYCDLAICDSVNIEKYIHECYDGKGIKGSSPKTTFIAYGADDAATGKMLVCVNPQWFRPTDVDNLWGDPTKAKTVLGWNPQSTTYEQLVEIMAKHDRERAKREKALKAVL